MQRVQSMQIDGSNLLEGAGGSIKQEKFDFGILSAGAHKRIQETEKLSKGEKTTEVTYLKPQQENTSGTMEDVMEQAGNIDAELMKNKMVVASNTTTTTDCRQAEQDGFSLTQTDMQTVVTAIDKIKIELAKAGVDVSYFGDRLSAEQLESFGGSAAIARQLAEKMNEMQADLPLTAQNIDDCGKALQQAGELHTLSDGALKYMLDNQLEPTIANLYKAQYSGSAVFVRQDAQAMDLSGMQEQISRIIAQSGLEENARTNADSRFMIQNQIPLTAENLDYLEQLKNMQFPLETDQTLEEIVTALSEGRRPQDACLLDRYSLAKKAQNAVDVIQWATGEDLAYVVSKGEAVTIRNLEKAHNQIAAGAVSETEQVAAAQLLKTAEEAEKAAQVQTAPGIQDTEHVPQISAGLPDAGDQPRAAAGGAVPDVQPAAGVSDTQPAAGALPSGQTPFSYESGQPVAQADAASISDPVLAPANGNVPVQQAAQTVIPAPTYDGRTAGANLLEPEHPQTVLDPSQTVQPVDEDQSSGTGNMQGNGSGSSQNQAAQYTQLQIELIAARRQLEEIRLKMTVSASYYMLKQGVSVDTTSMEELISHLKEIENHYYENLLKQGGVEATEENINLFAQASDKLEQLKEMPAYALGARNMTVSTLEELHQEGSGMQRTLEQANERYETMQTPVRSDLGDSMVKAFRNIDELLREIGQEVNPENKRAVRILGYNHLEITAENIMQMKAADQQVQMAFHNLTPAVIREFISKGINPLDLDIKELNREAEQIKTELHIDLPEEKYSEYLYKLEQNKNISPEERSSYIGIFRLMNHVAQSDGAAIGALVNQGAEITMRNLLAAVRSNQHGEMDITVDQSFGALESAGYRNSITKQIEAGYQHQCVKQAVNEISPERMRNVSNETKWEDLTPEQFLHRLKEAPQDLEAEEAYYQQQLEDLQQCAKTSEQVYKVLEQYELPNTVMNVMAVAEYLKNRNGAYRSFFGLDPKRTPDSMKTADPYMIKGEDGETEVDFDAIREELLRRFSEDVKKPKELAKAMAELAECAEKCMSTMIIESDVSSLDIRALKLMNAQISVHAKMASAESFSIPVVVDGEVTNVTLKIVRDKEQKGLVNLTLETSRFGKIAAEIKAKKNGFSGYLAADSKKTRDLLQSVEGDIAQALQEVQEGPLNINYIMSSSLDLNHFAAQSGTSEQTESEEDREVQTRTLYGMAEALIRVIRQLESAENRQEA